MTMTLSHYLKTYHNSTAEHRQLITLQLMYSILSPPPGPYLYLNIPGTRGKKSTEPTHNAYYPTPTLELTPISSYAQSQYPELLVQTRAYLQRHYWGLVPQAKQVAKIAHSLDKKWQHVSYPLTIGRAPSVSELRTLIKVKGPSTYRETQFYMGIDRPRLANLIGHAGLRAYHIPTNHNWGAHILAPDQATLNAFIKEHLQLTSYETARRNADYRLRVLRASGLSI